MATEKEFLHIKDFLQRCPTGSYTEWKSTQPKKKEKKEFTYPESFLTWWCTFPPKSKQEYKGIKFEGTRILRDKQEETYICYLQAVKEVGEQALLHALKVEIAERTKENIEKYKAGNKNYNSFDYMKATCAYLRSKRYSYYIDEDIPVIEKGDEQSIFTEA